MEIIWRPAATYDLELARRYIELHNPDAAQRTFARIMTAISRLSNRPHIGRPGRVAGTRELVISGTRYLVAYAVTERQIEILAVMHSARKWPETF
jgi:toxin ParE1/3/4